MRIFKTTGGGVNLAAGNLVRLTEAQAMYRLHNLRLVDGPAVDDRSTYEIINPLNFKVGEVFWYNGEVNRALLRRLDEIEVLMESWDPTAKVDDIINFAIMLPGFELDAKLKKKKDLVEAIEIFMTNPAPVVEEPAGGEPGDEEPVDLLALNLKELHEFAFKNQIEVDAFLDDKVEVRSIIEKHLAAATD